MRTYLNWKTETSSCTEQLAKGELGLDRRAELLLKAFAATNNNVGSNEWWDFSVRAEGHALLMDYRFKRPMDTNDFNARVGGLQKIMSEAYCAEGSWLLRNQGDRDPDVLQYPGRTVGKVLNNTGRLPEVVAPKR